MLRDGGKGEIDIPNRHLVFEGERYPLHRGCLTSPDGGDIFFTADGSGSCLVRADGTLVSLGDMRLND